MLEEKSPYQLNEIRYELECVFISKKSKKIGFITIRGSLGRANWNLPCADRHSKSVE